MTLLIQLLICKDQMTLLIQLQVYHLSLPVGAMAEIKAVAEDEIEQGLTDYKLRYIDILTS